MGFRTNNLHVFSISKDDNHQDKDLIEMWHNLDSDYDEDSDNWRVDDDLEELGYKSQAEKEIKQKDWIEDGHDDLSKIERVLQWIEQGHGNYSSQFLSEVTEGDSEYAVAVSYLI